MKQTVLNFREKNHNSIIFTCISVLILLLGVSCNNRDKERKTVDFSELENRATHKAKSNSKDVYIAIASMTSPKETLTFYHDLINYISDKVGYPIYIKQKKTYEEVNILLENGEVDFAFICSGAFADEYKKRKIKLLVAPQINQKTSYNAYIIANKEAGIVRFEEFENKSFAFTDPLSNTGRLYPLWKINRIETTASEFFMKTIYTYGHDISIQMVNRDIIDGASVHGLIYEYLALNEPEKVENIVVIEKSEDFGMPPVVTPSSLDKQTFEMYQKVFLNIHKDSLGKEILNRLNIDEFVIVGDSIYSSVFELKEYIDHVPTK